VEFTGAWLITRAKIGNNHLHTAGGDMIGNFLHVAIGVKEIEESVGFYTKVMGMELDYRAHHKGEYPSRISGVENAELDVCVLKKGQVRIELVDYANKNPSSGPVKQNQTGLVHICFLVTDIEHEYEKISALGYRFNSPPLQSRENGPMVCYFHGPDDVTIELYQPAQPVREAVREFDMTKE
jgi:catechol 2,3-dioxygenase-like lactoylglutathione lyase family enzyme